MSGNLSADPNIVTPDSAAARERSWTPPPDPNPVSPSPNVAFILASFLAGVDRTYIGQIGIGFLKLLTGGRAGWWWLIDLFLIRKQPATPSQQSLRVTQSSMSFKKNSLF